MYCRNTPMFVVMSLPGETSILVSHGALGRSGKVKDVLNHAVKHMEKFGRVIFTADESAKLSSLDIAVLKFRDGIDVNVICDSSS